MEEKMKNIERLSFTIEALAEHLVKTLAREPANFDKIRTLSKTIGHLVDQLEAEVEL